MFLTSLVLFLILCFLFYVYLTWDDNYWKKRNIPHDKPDLIFGDNKETMAGTVHFGTLYANLYKKYEGLPYIGIFKLKTPALMLRDPELIKSVLLTDFTCFQKNDFQADEKLDPLIQCNIFMQSGEQWKINRSAWTFGMTSTKLKSMFEVTKVKCNNMIQHIKQHCSENPQKPLETKDLTINYFIDVISTSVLKIQSNSFTDKSNVFKTIINQYFAPDFWDGIQAMIFMIAPKIAKIFKFGYMPKRIEKKLFNITRDVLKIREEEGYDKNNPFDVILKNQTSTKNFEVRAAGILFNFLTDGTETSATTTAFLLHSLAANPKIQSTLRQEINDHFKDEEVSYERLQTLEYLDMVLHETLRLYPPTLLLMKLSTKVAYFPPVLSENEPLKVEPNTPIIIPVYGLHMDPQYFPQPECFIPERFSNENRAKMNKFTYLSFGGGARTCIGMRLAMNQIKLGVVEIVRNFELKLSPKTSAKIDIDPNFFIYRAIGDLWLTFEPIVG